MLYDTVTKQPGFGSPLETVFMLLQRAREDRAFLYEKALFAAAGGHKNSVDFFNEYLSEISFQDARKEEDLKQSHLHNIMKDWVGRGTVQVPLPEVPDMRNTFVKGLTGDKDE